MLSDPGGGQSTWIQSGTGGRRALRRYLRVAREVLPGRTPTNASGLEAGTWIAANRAMRSGSRTIGLALLAVAVATWLLLTSPGGESPNPSSEHGRNTDTGTVPAGGVRLVGRSRRSTDSTADTATQKPEKAARVEGTVVAVGTEGTVPVADVPVVISFEAYRHKMGFSTQWICHRETVVTDSNGGYGLQVPECDYGIHAVYVTLEPREGWLTPPALRLSNGRVYVAVEIPTRIYNHSKWVSLPAPGSSAWPRDASGRWARPVLRLERAAGVEGLALDPWGKRLPNVLVGCSWPLRDVGLRREVVLTDSRGRFAFQVPASVPTVELDLNLRPRWGDLSPLGPPAKPRKSPRTAGPPPSAGSSATSSPNRHPWPGSPSAVVRPDARGVVLQAREEARLSGWIRTADGEVVREGQFDVQPGPDCPWPLGYASDYERRIQTSLEPDGRFVVHGLPAGQWVLVFRQERKDKPPLLGHVFTDAPAENVELICRPAVKLELEFVVPPGDPPLDPEAWVQRDFIQPASGTVAPGWWSDAESPLLMRFREVHDSSRRSGQPETRTDTWLENTRGVLYATSGDGRQALVENLDPAAGPQRIVLQPGGVIGGVIADYNLLGFLENGVRTYTPSIWVVARRGHITRKGTMTREGTFRIDGLPPGPWVVSLHGEHIYAKNPRARRSGVRNGTTDVILHAR